MEMNDSVVAIDLEASFSCRNVSMGTKSAFQFSVFGAFPQLLSLKYVFNSIIFLEISLEIISTEIPESSQNINMYGNAGTFFQGPFFTDSRHYFQYFSES